MGNYKYFNYLDIGVSGSRFPINTHLIFEIDYNNNPGRVILVDRDDRTKVYYSSDSGVTWTQMDVDPSNTSGDQKSRDHKIQSAWHDADNEIIWFVDCDNDDSDTDFDVWKLDYSTWGSFSITEIGSSTASSLVYAMDIFKISSDIFVMCREHNVCKVYDVDSAPFTEKDLLVLWLYGFFGGGDEGVATIYNIIDYVDIITTTGNAIDKGNLTQTRYGLAGVSGTTYGFFGGGYTGSTESNVIDYINVTTTSGNASDKGDLTQARTYLAGVQGSSYGFFAGGQQRGGGNYDIIDYINITTTSGNASDKGDLTVARPDLAGVNNSIYGFFGGGNDGANDDTIDYINITTTTGDALDKGNLTIGRRLLSGGVNGEVYGFFGGGVNGGVDSDVIDYINITTTSGNAVDKGNLLVARRSSAGVSGYGSNYGYFGGGYNLGSSYLDSIDYINITTTSGNAIDKGDLTQSRQHLGGVRM